MIDLGARLLCLSPHQSVASSRHYVILVTGSTGLGSLRDAPVTLPSWPKASLRAMKLAELQVLHFDGATFPLTAAELAAAGGDGQAWGVAPPQRPAISAAGREARAAFARRPPQAARAHGYTR